MYKNKCLFAIIFFSLIGLQSCDQPDNVVNVTVDAQEVINQMKGGIGASWHAMVKEIPLENEKYKYPIRTEGSRGSGYGGNPPFSDTAAWNQLYKHAKWLGLDFLRVELSQNMYEPEKDVFDWENEEMQTLYRILDWCEANNADVFLQQMWGHVAWNAYPGVHPLLSAPRSLDDFANGIATLLEHLTKTRKYTCIKYFCMTNEPPGSRWGYWWESGDVKGNSLTDAWKKLSETFKAREISVLISGPDWTSLAPFDAADIDFDPYVGSYDIHSYTGVYNTRFKKDSVLIDIEKIISGWVNWARSKNKPLFLSEFGNMGLGWGKDNPAPKSFKAALSNASDVVVCMNMGVDGFNRWSFTNRGDMDGQWQLVNTYDINTKTYTKTVKPENEAYYGFAMLSRFLGKYATVLSHKTDQKIDSLLITAYKNRDGNLSVLLVNNKKEPVAVKISVENHDKKSPFHLYQVTESLTKDPAFELNPAKTNKNLKSIVLLPQSISVFTTLGLKQTDTGVIE